MSDLDRELQRLNDLHAPDLTSRIGRPPYGQRPVDGPTTGGRFAALVVAALVAVTGVGFGVTALQPADEPRTGASPDLQERLVFGTLPLPDVPGQIFSVRPDGSGLEPLTSGARSHLSPTVSPDGTKIAFVGFDWDGASDDWHEAIYVMDSDGTNVREIRTAGEPSPVSVTELAWSPDGSSIGFIQRYDPDNGDAPGKLWLMAPDGSNAHRLLDVPVESFAWSPDGARIAYTPVTLVGNRWVTEMWVMDADGGGAAPLTTTDGSPRSPEWSPDGSRIAFLSEDGAARTIEVVGVGGTERTLLVPGDRVNSFAWSPDGSRLVVDRSHETPGTCVLEVLPVGRQGEGEVVMRQLLPDLLDPTATPPDVVMCAASIEWTHLSAPAGEATPEPERDAPVTASPTPHGDAVASGLPEGKTVIVGLWDTNWDGTLTQLRLLQELGEKYASYEDIEVIGVGLGEPDDLSEYLRERYAEGATPGFDPTFDGPHLVQSLGIDAVPATHVVAPSGQIVASIEGGPSGLSDAQQIHAHLAKIQEAVASSAGITPSPDESYRRASQLDAAAPPCPRGAFVDLVSWEHIRAAANELGDGADATEWAAIDQYTVAPDDVTPFVSDVPDGMAFVVTCSPISASELVLTEGDGVFIPREGNVPPSANGAGSTGVEELERIRIAGDNGLTAADAIRYEGAIFTNTTPAEVVVRLQNKIAEVEAEAAGGDSSQAAAAVDDVAYLEALIALVCEQEVSARC